MVASSIQYSYRSKPICSFPDDFGPNDLLKRPTQRSNVIDGPTVMNRLQIETNDIYVNFVVIGQLQRFEMAI